MDLSTPVGKLPAVGPIYQRRLVKLDIYTVNDLLLHIPFRYDDFSLVSKITNIQEGETITIQGKIVNIKNEFTRARRFIQKATVQDDTGEIDVVWFNQTYLTRSLPPGTLVSLSGKVDTFRKKLAMVSPAFETLTTDAPTIHTGRLVPIYPETYGLSSKWLRAKIRQLLTLSKEDLQEYLPIHLLTKNGLMSFTDALERIHFPQNHQEAQKARERLAFDEFLLMQLRSLLRKKEWEQKRQGIPLHIVTFKKEIGEFWQRLPFELTNAQKRAVKEIFADLAAKKPMNRLLEGDVGSGKTVVAAIGVYLTYLNGYQSVLMTPTQILANQHFNTISNLLSPLGVNIGLVTGDRKRVNGNETLIVKRLRKTSPLNDTGIDTDKRSTKPNILIGTHALLSKSIAVDKLAFVVIDEQHRFGVEQRGLLLKKNGQLTPHVLTMTATPIPRTVALTMYGDLDLSYLDEMPKGRITVKTWVVPPQKRTGAYNWISEKIVKEQAQVFIICPFIEESETQTTVKAATKEYEHLQNDVFKNQRVGLLHGRMRVKDKEKVMEEFRSRMLDILVATPVVEVGIDIPGATIIMIEGSERFGLAQLHQLRGRVGRSTIQSYCLLFTDPESQSSLRRVKNLERIGVGAELAELDLRLRGPGELHGTMQHGIPKLKVARFSDRTLIEKTRKVAFELLRKDPALTNASLLKEKLKTYTIQPIEPN